MGAHYAGTGAAAWITMTAASAVARCMIARSWGIAWLVGTATSTLIALPLFAQW
jgi:hypothetical protein